MKIVVTGGHTAPALACVDELLKEKVDIVFIGRKYNTDREKSETFEYKEVTTRKIRFHHLVAGRVTRFISLKNIKGLLQIPIGFLQAYTILKKEKPDAILSFGGYIALPVALIGKLLGIKIYTHEQTIHPGVASRLISNVAETVFLSFDESKDFFPHQKVKVTGNPIRANIVEKAKTSFDIPKGKPVVYVTGGSLGSHSINEHIQHIIRELIEETTVIHQTGNVIEYHDYENSMTVRDSLPEKYRDRYIVREHFSSSDVAGVYQAADLVISRCGANTFFELVALKKAAILIPLPWSAHQEQQRQAEILEKAGVGEIFNQYDTSEDLLALTWKMIKNIESYRKNFKELSGRFKHEAAQEIIREVQNRQGSR